MNLPRHLPTIILTCVSAASSVIHLQAGTVMNTLDSGPGSLRTVLDAAAADGETIDFAPSLNGATITLTSGELLISEKQLTIDASPLPHGVKISGNNNSRIFNIVEFSNITLRNLELSNGRPEVNQGGGIRAIDSQLFLSDIIIQDCFSSTDGGGLWANSTSGILDRCSFLGNESAGPGGGGGIFLAGSPLTVTNSVIAGNRASTGLGGGISCFAASPAITNCTIQGNSGSGLYAQVNSALTLRNTIVWGNRTGSGTIASQQIQTVTGSTANTDYCLVGGSPSSLNNLDGTLPANNPNFVNPATPVNSDTPPSSQTDLRFLTPSPVVDVGNNGSNATLLDRAGKARIQGVKIDLGAFEGGYVTFASLHPSLNKTDDTNGNRLSNFLEYATGIDPSAPDNPAARPMMSRSGGFNFLTTSQRSNAADVSFSWETSTSMETLSWQKMLWGIDYTVESTTNPSPDRQQVVFKLLSNDPRRFYRQAFLDNP